MNLDCSGKNTAAIRTLVQDSICSSIDGYHIHHQVLLSDSCSNDKDVLSLNRIRNQWPQLPSRSVKDRCLSEFITSTSSSTLKTLVCASCGERTFSESIHVVDITDIDIRLLIRPDYDTYKDLDNDESAEVHTDWLHSHAVAPILPFSTGVLADILVDRRGVTFDGIEPMSLQLCDTCCKSLQRGAMPRLAIANRLFIGDVPIELQNLTPIEESMISLCHAKCMIIHLRSASAGLSSDTATSCLDQRGVKGHIIVHPQQAAVVAELLPPSIEDIVAPVCVIFVGSHPPSNEWIMKHAKPLAVRVNIVRRALVWLKHHNYLYRNIRINDAVLNDIDRMSSLPFHVEHLEEGSDVPVSNYVPNESVDVANMDEIPFESVYITDVDGHATSNQLRAAAVKHVREKGGGYIELPHGENPENEFNNSQLFPKLYPSLFPYGIGGFEDSRRKIPVAMQSQIKHFMNIADRRFKHHQSFIFTAFNILQR